MNSHYREKSADTEALRQRLVSLITDCQGIKRKAKRIAQGRDPRRRAEVTEVRHLAERIDYETRELFFLLPEHLRPTGVPRLSAPRTLRAPYVRPRNLAESKPGKPIPREVRWPDWTIEMILALADAYYARHGRWPDRYSGRVSETSSDTWVGIDIALRRGNRNLPGGSSLAKLLWEYRGVRTSSMLPLHSGL